MHVTRKHICTITFAILRQRPEIQTFSCWLTILTLDGEKNQVLISMSISISNNSIYLQLHLHLCLSLSLSVSTSIFVSPLTSLHGPALQRCSSSSAAPCSKWDSSVTRKKLPARVASKLTDIMQLPISCARSPKCGSVDVLDVHYAVVPLVAWPPARSQRGHSARLAEGSASPAALHCLESSLVTIFVNK